MNSYSARADLIRVIEESVAAFDEPLADPAALPLLELPGRRANDNGRAVRRRRRRNSRGLSSLCDRRSVAALFGAAELDYSKCRTRR